MNTSSGSFSAAVAAGAGVLAAAAGLAVGEVVAAPVRTWLSPVVAIGDRVVDAVPEPVKAFAIAVFGTNDKIALLVGIVVLLAVFAAVIGLVARRRRGVALGLTASFGVIGAIAAIADPSLGISAALPSVVAGVAAVGTLAWLTREERDVVVEGESRRNVLADLGKVALGAAVLGGGGRFVSRQRASQLEAAREATGLPAPTDAVTIPDGQDLAIDGLSPFQTPNSEFYRIDTRLDTPRLERDGWTLKVTGQVENELEFTLDELEDRFEVIERVITMTCVSNEVGGNLAGTATWRGVRVADVLEAAGVESSATQVVGRAFDDFTVGYPVEAAFDRDAMLVVGMNGEPLPAEHGFPLRMVVPGLYGYVSATKWLTELELTTFEAFDQYWVERDWEPQAPIKTMSRIDTPGSLERVGGDTVAVAGVAWAQTRGITKVEVSIDGGEWQEAELGPEFNDVTWRQWVYRWDTSGLEEGRHELRCRATDSTGETQTEERQPPFPDGATGWHSVVVLT